MTKFPKISEIAKAVMAAADGAKGDVIEDVEARDLSAELMQVIHHNGLRIADCGLRNSSRTRSVRAERLPFTRTRSPGDAIPARSSAASAGVFTLVAFSRPADLAACAIAAPNSPMVMR